MIAIDNKQKCFHLSLDNSLCTDNSPTYKRNVLHSDAFHLSLSLKLSGFLLNSSGRNLLHWARFFVTTTFEELDNLNGTTEIYMCRSLRVTPNKTKCIKSKGNE